jgi:co-chaperonin GroES (HSP10)
MLRIHKIKPLFTSVVTTGDKFEKDMVEGGIIIARKGDLKLWQKVIAVGTSVRDIKEGDLVMINADHYVTKKYSKDSIQNDIDNNPILGYKFNWVTIDDEKGNPKECLLLNDRDILYSFEGEERDDIITISGKQPLIIS